MSAVSKKKLTPAEYLAVEREATFKSEFYNGETFAMAGASRAHTELAGSIESGLRNRLRGSGCQTLSRDMRVRVSPNGLYTYPDVLIYCGTPMFEDENEDTLLNPRVLIEVLSDSTEAYDRGAKFRLYEQIETFQEYVLVSQDEHLVERFVRQPDGTWTRSTVAGRNAEFAFATVPVTIPMAEIYENVTFPDPPPPLR